ncbi:GNAT family N-acetyltransferase [Caldimonas tepidiphila]|uniref:GNAT family N-acetyltransferase n=1 Tax=Caldimonas tepidiphila TaxID=2315841 RepID=UPI000E5BCD3A|nr:GNAT family N-acetyltransferase [Caldimonas tepidiphila]
MDNTSPLQVEHDAAGRRFHASVDGLSCVAAYELGDGVMQMTHTVVPPELQGRGIAARLVETAFAHARREGLKVQPVCAYVQAYMRRHPETDALRA